MKSRGHLPGHGAIELLHSDPHAANHRLEVLLARLNRVALPLRDRGHGDPAGVRKIELRKPAEFPPLPNTCAYGHERIKSYSTHAVKSDSTILVIS